MRGDQAGGFEGFGAGSRREFLERSVIAGAGVLLPFAVASPALSKGSKQTIELPGPSGADDTSRLRTAINKAPAGSTLLAKPHATYRVSDTLEFKRPDVTLDLQRATILQVAYKGRMAVFDTVFDLMASGVTLRNGQIFARAPFDGHNLVAGKVRIVKADGCTIEDLTLRHNGRSSAGVLIYFGGEATIRNVRAFGGSITGLGCSGAVVDRCRVGPTAQGVNGISLISYKGHPVEDAVVTGNRVKDYGRFGIEVSGDASSSPFDISRPRVSGNKIEPPRSGAVAGAISCVGHDCEVSDNRIYSPQGTGIEVAGLGNTVTGNHITRSSGPSLLDSGFGIVVDNHDKNGGFGPTLVARNTIELCNQAIYGANDPGTVRVKANTIVDPLVTGIDMGGTSAATVITKNQLHFTRPGNAVTNRRGIVYGANARVQRNTLVYEPSALVRPVLSFTSDTAFDGPQAAQVDSNSVTGL